MCFDKNFMDQLKSRIRQSDVVERLAELAGMDILKFDPRAEERAKDNKALS